MTFEKTSQEYEIGRLQLVMEKIREQLAKCRESADDLRKNVISIQKSMWGHINPTPRDLNDLADIWQVQTDIVREGRKAIFSAGRVERLKRLLDSPYFARLDFREDGQPETEQIYIGLSNLSDEKTGEYYIYDWRAPVSSMFYDYETGRAGYECPAGRIEGDVSLKRQYRIWRGRLEFMFDCSLAIEDDVLQEILSRSADGRMKTIVTSIQREQNRVIRDDSHRLVIVKGPAGGGKTSIALHRAAFLLYRYKESISAENIAIFSPNNIFSDYISEVLPELGEENIRRTTFMEYAGKVLDRSFKAESPADLMEYILSCRDKDDYRARISGVRYKASQSFMDVLENYALEIEKGWLFKDIYHNGACIESKEDIEDYFRNGLKFLPVSKRLEKIRNRLVNKLDPMIKERIEELVEELAKTGEYPDKAEIRGRSTFLAREEFRTVREEIEAMTRIDPVEFYVRLFSEEKPMKLAGRESLPDGFDDMSAFTDEAFERRIIPNEDVAPLLYLTDLLSGTPPMDDIKHVIIDEVQDYSVIQLKLMQRLFRNSSLTLLGDDCQSINPYSGSSDIDATMETFAGFKSIGISLTKSYRSTRQITAFCRNILGVEGVESVERDGPEPEIIYRDTEAELYGKLFQDIDMLKREGLGSIAVICRTAWDAGLVYDRLSHHIEARLVTASDEDYVKGVSVIPSYLSKGLEFDAVLALCLKAEDYAAKEERKLFYTVCTRALHRLNVYRLGRSGQDVFMKGKLC